MKQKDVPEYTVATWDRSRAVQAHFEKKLGLLCFFKKT